AMSYAIVINNATIDGNPLDLNDEVGVFAVGSSGPFCVGAAIYGSFPLSITAWEDDPLTPQKDGFTAGEPIIFRIWDSSENVEFMGIFTIVGGNGDGNFGTLPFTMVDLQNGAFIPTISEWGMIIMSLLLLITGTLVLRRRRLALAKARI
ncbi:MAG: IPTL-CTERM sorting domain-containing protein, partial [Planctomycetes bacterium]|nr:IPTL-CTERM sorting domain-containing protein [Planctomycetota bacterium]